MNNFEKAEKLILELQTVISEIELENANLREQNSDLLGALRTYIECAKKHKCFDKIRIK